MRASILDLRRRMKDVLAALDRGEQVVLLHRGKEKGVIHPLGSTPARSEPASGHPAFGMWKDREDLCDVDQAVRNMRKGRFRDL